MPPNWDTTTHLVLIETDGRVFSARAFASRHAHLLSVIERRFLQERLQCLQAETEIPGVLQNPVRAIPRTTSEAKPGIEVLRSGGRSAYWEEAGLKLKGCRPSCSGRDFPLYDMPFDHVEIHVKRIPFGVMSGEAVMRELLGYCFCQKHGIPTNAKPVCVYSYTREQVADAYCLVLKTDCETRVESFLQIPDLRLRDVVNAASGNESIKYGIGSEINLRRLNIWWFAREKAKFLAEMHVHGGFRGVLNSGIGNDVIRADLGGKLAFAFCDFDSFKLIDMPTTPTTDFVERFALHCLLEVVRGSLPILRYVHLSEGSTAAEMGRIIGNVYTARSSVWHAYIKKMLGALSRCQVVPEQFEMAIERAFGTSAFLDASCAVLLSHYGLNRMKLQDRAKYVFHNTF